MNVANDNRCYKRWRWCSVYNAKYLNHWLLDIGIRHLVFRINVAEKIRHCVFLCGKLENASLILELLQFCNFKAHIIEYNEHIEYTESQLL